MKHWERRTTTDLIVTKVTCDITNKECPVLPSLYLDCDAVTYEHGTLQYQGGYGADFDMLDVELHLHPDVVAALYLMSEQGQNELKSGSWSFRQPRLKITIEELNGSEE